jgi:predicted flap endonuclease-1-like 5' DNA nuclease
MKPAVDTESVPTASGSNEAVTGIRATADGKRADETQVTDTPTEEIEIEAIEAAELSASAIPIQVSTPPPAAPPEEPRRKTSMPPPLPAAAMRARLPATPARGLPAPSLGLTPLGQLLPPAAQRDPNSRASLRPAVAIVGSEEALAELERVTKRMRERVAYLAELEQVYAQRSDALLKAEKELDELRAELSAQARRIAELEQQLKTRASSPPPARASQPPSEPKPLGPQSSHDLTRIRGIGPGYARSLYAMGVSSFTHIAAWTADDIANIGRKLKTPAGRIERDRWVDQARELLGDKV